MTSPVDRTTWRGELELNVTRPLENIYRGVIGGDLRLQRGWPSVFNRQLVQTGAAGRRPDF
jgi:hypothetical protein